MPNRDIKVNDKQAMIVGNYLHEVVEDAQTLRILAGLDIDEGADLGGGEGDVLVPHDNLELLPSDTVGLRPVAVVLLHDLFQSPKIQSIRDSSY
jgi:hypothetical protein